ncbi:MAG: putative ABC transporter permease [Clostridium sp.]|nr:putative ABC transporter permease [Clostridium sp.]
MWFLYFVIYSFLGWICEVIYCSIPAKKFINRGFLKGPICPVYGFGAVFVIYIMTSLNIKSPILIFIFGGIIASVIEFIADLMLEYVFHTRLWDYSNRKFNIKGRVCLLNSTLFSILSLVLMSFIHPIIMSYIKMLSNRALIIIVIICMLLLITDILRTVLEVINLNTTLKNMSLLKELKKEFSKKEIKFIRLINAFPQLEHKRYKEEFNNLKIAIKEAIKNNIK